eukprot:TRINITY_DN3556_c0_g1_i7.p1 TRINITY_DN3556_c0_g1~~TRINITY_DN3556_c0_g1_i7.p1  ORF type:complete len:763 (-),score=173.17 TRINITY_DN3556_c0_g1_i7:47-2245(-)
MSSELESLIQDAIAAEQPTAQAPEPAPAPAPAQADDLPPLVPIEEPAEPAAPQPAEPEPVEATVAGASDSDEPVEFPVQGSPVASRPFVVRAHPGTDGEGFLFSDGPIRVQPGASEKEGFVFVLRDEVPEPTGEPTSEAGARTRRIQKSPPSARGSPSKGKRRRNSSGLIQPYITVAQAEALQNLLLRSSALGQFQEALEGRVQPDSDGDVQEEREADSDGAVTEMRHQLQLLEQQITRFESAVAAELDTLRQTIAHQLHAANQRLASQATTLRDTLATLARQCDRVAAGGAPSQSGQKRKAVNVMTTARRPSQTATRASPGSRPAKAIDQSHTRSYAQVAASAADHSGQGEPAAVIFLSETGAEEGERDNAELQHYAKIEALVFSRSLREVEQGVAALVRLVSHKEPTLEVLLKRLDLLLPRLQQLLGVAQLQEPVLRFLANFIAVSDRPDAVLRPAGLLQQVISLLSAADVLTGAQAARVIGNIAGCGEKYRDIVIERGTLQQIASLLPRFAAASLAAAKAGPAAPEGLRRTFFDGVWAAANLCRGTPPPAVELIGPALQVLTRLLAQMSDAPIRQEGDETAIENILSAFHSVITHGDADHAALLLQLNVPELALALLHPRSPHALSLCRLVQAFIVSPTSRAATMRLRPVDLLLQVRQTTHDENVQRVIQDTLTFLAHAIEEAPAQRTRRRVFAHVPRPSQEDIKDIELELLRQVLQEAALRHIDEEDQ